MDRFDYVIIGGGSAGCVLAHRLSAVPSLRVALIEAGADFRTRFLQCRHDDEAGAIAHIVSAGFECQAKDGNTQTIDRATGRIRHHEANRLRRKALRRAWHRCGDDRSECQQHTRRQVAYRHCDVPWQRSVMPLHRQSGAEFG